MQPVGQPVEVDEAGGDSDHLAATRGDALDLGDGTVHDLGQRQVVLGGAHRGDIEDLGLGPVDHHVDVTLAGVGDLGDARAGLDEAPTNGGVAHDLGVVAGVGGGRDGRDQGVQVGVAADTGQVAGFDQGR